MMLPLMLLALLCLGSLMMLPLTLLARCCNNDKECSGYETKDFNFHISFWVIKSEKRQSKHSLLVSCCLADLGVAGML